MTGGLPGLRTIIGISRGRVQTRKPGGCFAFLEDLYICSIRSWCYTYINKVFQKEWHFLELIIWIFLLILCRDKKPTINLKAPKLKGLNSASTEGPKKTIVFAFLVMEHHI